MKTTTLAVLCALIMGCSLFQADAPHEDKVADARLLLEATALALEEFDLEEDERRQADIAITAAENLIDEWEAAGDDFDGRDALSSAMKTLREIRAAQREN